MDDRKEQIEQWHTPFYASYEIDFRRYEEVLKKMIEELKKMGYTCDKRR